MSPRSLPLWNGMGILPPIRPGKFGSSLDRSPYQITLFDFFDRFSLNPERVKILKGFLSFRSELHKLGIVNGFQWLDGSFLENIEVLKKRPPHDLDIVTFYQLPDGETEQSLIQKNKDIFDNEYLKGNFAIDGYFVPLIRLANAKKIKRITYWYSMWSHRRGGRWKGFVQIDLEPSQDAEANKYLEVIKKLLKFR
jgi:hypothetical protein